jgi:hypothetical protein
MRHGFLGLLAGAILWGAPAAARGEAAFWRVAADFLTQNVCLDAQQRPIVGASPLECAQQRDLRPGEHLPYHKHDWPNSRQSATRPTGDERQDSIPVALGGRTAFLQTFDSGIAPRAFGGFEPTDGGQLVLLSPTTASVVLTRDGKGAKIFAGPGCRASPSGAGAIEDTWVLFGEDPRAGRMVARLKLQLAPGCPDRFNASYTVWETRMVSYRRTLDGAETPLRTIVSDHFSQATVEQSASMERHYLTRELGVARWERWQNLTRLDKPEYRERSAAYARSGRCPARAPAPEPGEWVLVACREWTNIVPPASPGGDDPAPWVERYFSDPLIASVVGAPGRPR